jgi:hypothetical protein
MPDTEAPPGRYKCFATFMGARSRTVEVEVYRLTLVLPSPNNEKEEIVITPFCEQFPIHYLKYQEFLDRCAAALKEKYGGEIGGVQIPAYELITMGVGPGGTMGRRQERMYPLRDFASFVVRKKQLTSSVDGK